MKVIFRMQLFHNLLSLTFTKHSVFPCDLSAQIVQTKYSTLIEMCEIQTRKKIYHILYKQAHTSTTKGSAHPIPILFRIAPK